MKENDWISISAIASISPLGIDLEETASSYQQSSHCLKPNIFDKSNALAAPLTTEGKQKIEHLRQSNPLYKKLDDTVLYAIFAAQKAIDQCQWNSSDSFGINIGSSRGATQLFEYHHEQFLHSNRNQSAASPTTTLGNISSWVAQHVQTDGPVISHSITCSTALHALLNGAAWIKSGMASKFIVGGSEAALTPFTLSQMKALRIYSNEQSDYPCRPLDHFKKANTMVLGEGASLACLERGIHQNTLAVIEGIGYATEVLKHNVSISTDAKCFQKSIKMALGKVDKRLVDIIITHAPGTIKGDMAEMNAIKTIFDNKLPAITSNKWKIGHTFAASGMLNIEMAILMLKNQKFIEIPYLDQQKRPEQINKILVNAVGFGGNAVSILLSSKSNFEY